jgi:DNA end-binding protein Ku
MSSGTISFGLVAIPVNLYSTGETQKKVSFSMVHEECGTRVKYRYYCPTDDKLIERDEITKGYEFAKGQFVLFNKDELKALDPEPTNAIEIQEFVPLEQVDPIYFEKAYYLGPGKAGAKPYKLLARALADTGRAALAKYAARGKNYIVLLRPFQGGLIMQQLRYSVDLREFSEVPIEEAEIVDAELALAKQIVEQSSADEFKPEQYEDEVRNQVWELIEKKIGGEEIVAAPQEAPKAQIIDLMEALKASLGDDKEAGRKPPKRSKRKPAAATAKKKKAAKG